jgi:hypothetical protein
MGGGKWDDTRYRSAASLRSSKGLADFGYTETHEAKTKVHDNLDPKRINSKTFKKLESRDSAEHPNSNAVFVAFDVTGSNYERAVDAQKKLPNLMTLLGKYLSDPQIAVAANDDINVEPARSTQISDFESDNRIDEHIRNVTLVRNGGGNDGESYDLLMYAAARKTVLDCFEKRGRKGYFFMYADEPIFDVVSASEVKSVFGDNLQGDIPIAEIIEDLRKLYHVFVIWPVGGYDHARKQYLRLFGEESVLTLQHPNLICELIGATIGVNEELVSVHDVTADLVHVGTSSHDASEVTKALAHVAKGRGNIAKSSGSLPSTGGSGGATRL